MDRFAGSIGYVLVVWLVSLTVNLVVYAIATGSIYYALRFFWEKGLKTRKIQQRAASHIDIRREIVASLRSALIFSVIYAATYLAANAKLFTVYPGIEPLGIPYLVVSIGALLVAHDTYFYWLHRLMHNRFFFRRFHRTHHKSVTPTVFACYAFDAPEAFLLGCFAPLWLLVVPMQLAGLLIPAVLILARNAIGHSGVELFAREADGGFWYGWLTTNTEHDLHHSTGRHNFGLLFNGWDRLMGTRYPSSSDHARGGHPVKALEP